MSVITTERAPAHEVTRRDVYTRAADLLEEFGWCQNVYAVDSRGDEVDVAASEATLFCLRGAIYRACHDLGVSMRAGGRVNSPAWNDNPARTKEEVVAHLRELANG